MAVEEVGIKQRRNERLSLITGIESKINLDMHAIHTTARVRPRFFDQVGHESMYASSGNKHFFTKSCHLQTYQNYEQPPQTSQNSYFQSHFSV
mgnify:CR=1 FL=1